MSEQTIKIINENLEIIKNRDNFAEEQVENALKLVSENCVKLFLIKTAKNFDGKFDFWKVIESKELEKCFKPLLVAKIKHTVRRCEIFEIMRKKGDTRLFYKEDLISWSFGIVEESQIKISEFC